MHSFPVAPARSWPLFVDGWLDGLCVSDVSCRVWEGRLCLVCLVRAFVSLSISTLLLSQCDVGGRSTDGWVNRIEVDWRGRQAAGVARKRILCFPASSATDQPAARFGHVTIFELTSRNAAFESLHMPAGGHEWREGEKWRRKSVDRRASIRCMYDLLDGLVF